jgi:hypothetical protein
MMTEMYARGIRVGRMIRQVVISVQKPASTPSRLEFIYNDNYCMMTKIATSLSDHLCLLRIMCRTIVIVCGARNGDSLDKALRGYVSYNVENVMDVALPPFTLRTRICPEGDGDFIDYLEIKVCANREGNDQAVVHKVGL